MNEKELEIKALKVISKVLGREVKMTDEISEIEEWDSLRHLQIILELEDAFGVNIPMERVGDLKAVRDLVKTLKEVIER